MLLVHSGLVARVGLLGQVKPATRQKGSSETVFLCFCFGPQSIVLWGLPWLCLQGVAPRGVRAVAGTEADLHVHSMKACTVCVLGLLVSGSGPIMGNRSTCSQDTCVGTPAPTSCALFWVGHGTYISACGAVCDGDSHCMVVCCMALP